MTIRQSAQKCGVSVDHDEEKVLRRYGSCKRCLVAMSRGRSAARRGPRSKNLSEG